jgi:anaerobic magnesium-protoporphyrin IX monomethyl ester cyclase
MKYDIVIIILPFLKNMDQIGPALLKANIIKHGYTCKIINWNYKIFSEIKNKDIEHRNLKYYTKEISLWIDEIKQYNPKYIGLSLCHIRFSDDIFKYMIKPLKNNFLNSKFVVGGSCFFIDDFKSTYIKNNPSHYVVIGDGEDAIVQILKTDTWDNNIGLNVIKNLDNYPAPDYSDSPSLMKTITFSRGCFNNCKFCNTPHSSVRYRSPLNVVKELVDIWKKYKKSSFIFTDSLINSNRKKLEELCNLIIEYKKQKKLPENLNLVAFMYCFKENERDEIIYNKMKKAGFSSIYIGLESGSEKVRKEMNKMITNKNFNYMFKFLTQNNINIYCSLITGFYTETNEDFQETLTYLRYLKENFNTNYIIINIGSIHMINNISAWKHVGVVTDGLGSWVYKDNTHLVRVKRWVKVIELCLEIDLAFVDIYHHLLYNDIIKHPHVKGTYLEKKIVRLLENKIFI